MKVSGIMAIVAVILAITLGVCAGVHSKHTSKVVPVQTQVNPWMA